MPMRPQNLPISIFVNTAMLACALLHFILPLYGQSRTQKQDDYSIQMPKVDAFIQDELAKREIPAMTISVIRDGKIIHEAGYGMADRDNRVRARPDTPFYVASVTKAFTGTSLILLEGEHRIDLDRPVNYYLRSAKIHSLIWDVSAATVRRVANHTSGLTTYDRKCAVGDSLCQPSTEAAIS